MTPTGGSKRSRPLSDALSPSNVGLEFKRRKLDGSEPNTQQQSPEGRLGSIAAAIHGFLGYSNPTPDPDTSQENVPPVEQVGKPLVQTEASAPASVSAPTSACAPPIAKAPNLASTAQQSKGTAVVAPYRVEVNMPFTARSPIKMSALKKAKKDAGGGVKASPARKRTAIKPDVVQKPAAKPRGGRKAMSAVTRSLENSGDVPQPDAAMTNGTHLPVPSPAIEASLPGIMETPTKKRLFSPAVAPKGILTPTKKRGRPSKNVTFDGDEPLDRLPRSASAKKKRGRPPKKLEEPDGDDIVCGICAKPHSKPPNEIILCDHCDFAAHQECYDVPEIPEGDWLCKSCEQEDVLQTPRAEPGSTAPLASASTRPTEVKEEVPAIANLGHHLGAMQRVLLDRCAGRRRIRMFGQDEAGEKMRQLLEQTVLAGEGNSMLLIGPRGSGKTTLVEETVLDLSREHGHDFHVVRLNGFIHTDDKLALREIWRQLGKEMKVDDDVLNRSSYADTMASLLALLSHPSEILGQDEGVTSQAVVFVIDEFDMFATHPRQTLLYNLFDIAQSRKAPVAVLGCTTRLDVVEMLEKRVKSRFSHRYVYLSLARNLHSYWQVCRQGLMLGETDGGSEGMDVGLEGYVEFQRYWNRKIEDLYKLRQFQDLLQYHYYTTKSVSAFFSEWMLPLSRLTATNLTLRVPTTEPGQTPTSSLASPGSRLPLLLASLSELDLGLLIAAARLDVVAHTDTVNFAMAYDEYTTLVGRQRAQSASAGLLVAGAGSRVWGRGVASAAWERLVGLGLVVPSGIGGRGVGGGGGLDGRMWRVDVALEEIPGAIRLSAAMARWCREI